MVPSAIWRIQSLQQELFSPLQIERLETQKARDNGVVVFNNPIPPRIGKSA